MNSRETLCSEKEIERRMIWMRQEARARKKYEVVYLVRVMRAY
jgi:hypothetical protein